MSGEKSTTIERTTISIDGIIFREAKLRAESAGIKFSNHVEKLLKRDLEGEDSEFPINTAALNTISQWAQYNGLSPESLLNSVSSALADYLRYNKHAHLPFVVMSFEEAAALNDYCDRQRANGDNTAPHGPDFPERVAPNWHDTEESGKTIDAYEDELQQSKTQATKRNSKRSGRKRA